jgi:hypothetical protein
MRQYKTPPIPWVRASDMRLRPHEISAPVTPLIYKAVATLFVYVIMYISIFYLLFAIWYNLVRECSIYGVAKNELRSKL